MSMTPSGFFANRGLYDPFTGPALTLWDPFRDFSSLIPPPELAGAAAACDWRETPEAHVFMADLPGVRKEEVKVEVEDGGVLSISGERRREKEEKTDTWHRVERSSGRFDRRFRLPENVEVDRITAAMENGVLTVTVPKDAGKEAREGVKCHRGELELKLPPWS